MLVANRGVDKTLIAATLASALAHRGERVALADRELSSLESIKQQWQPILVFLTA